MQKQQKLGVRNGTPLGRQVSRQVGRSVCREGATSTSLTDSWTYGVRVLVKGGPLQ
jgi:hypothetical protein